jgi:hypothetical protein
MTTFWINPTLSPDEQQQLHAAWTQQFMDESHAVWAMMWSDSDSDDEEPEEAAEFGDDEWEDGPQTPPLGPRPLPRPPLVSIGGGLAASVEDIDEEEDASSVSAGVQD